MAAKYSNLNVNKESDEASQSAQVSFETDIQNQSTIEVEDIPRAAKLPKRCVICIGLCVGLVIIGTIIIAVAVSATRNSSSPAESNHNHGMAASHTGQDVTEYMNPEIHLVNTSSRPDKKCIGVVYHTNGEAKSEAKGKGQVTYEDSIKNSSCFLCNDSCLNMTSDRFVRCELGSYFINCEVRRDMKNYDDKACGSKGQYECYGDDPVPKCNCSNGKKGDNCDVDYKAYCKCWNTFSELIVSSETVDCSNPGVSKPKTCTKNLGQNIKCLCEYETKDNIEEYSEDCSSGMTAENQVAKSCGPIVQSSFTLLVCAIAFIWHRS